MIYADAGAIHPKKAFLCFPYVLRSNWLDRPPLFLRCSYPRRRFNDDHRPFRLCSGRRISWFSVSRFPVGRRAAVVFYLFSSVTYLYVLLLSCACTNDGQLPSCAVGSGLCSRSVENRKKTRSHTQRKVVECGLGRIFLVVWKVGTRSRSQTGKSDSNVCFSLLFRWPFFGFLQVVWIIFLFNVQRHNISIESNWTFWTWFWMFWVII